MTIPVERTRAVLQTKQFLLDLLDPQTTPRVPRAVRQRAVRCLRHYPWPYHLWCAAQARPEHWGDPDVA